MSEPKFKKGDKVRIVLYGEKKYFHKDGMAMPKKIIGENSTDWIGDRYPELVGKEAIIFKAIRLNPTGQWVYLMTEKLKNYPWFDEEQLELVQ